MVCEILKSIHNGATIFRPAGPSALDGWELFDMLERAFPFRQDSQFNFFICCAAGYETAVIFESTQQGLFSHHLELKTSNL